MKVFIVGASVGIGAGLALDYAKKGADVFLVSRNELALKEIKDKITSLGVKVDYAICDVRNKLEIQKAFELGLKFLGEIDIAIINAGISGSENFSDFDSNQVINIYHTNVFSVVYFLELFSPYFRNKGKGKFVAVSSLADSRGYPGSGAYCSSKAALTKILESARNDLKPDGIKVITVKPGFVRTAMTAKNNFPMPFMMEVDRASKIIISGIDKNKKEIRFPGILSVLSKMAEFVPIFIFDAFIGKVKREK